MAFKNNIPQSDHKLNRSQPELRANFLEIDNWVNQDHVGFGTDQGKHQTVRFVDQTSAPTINNPETGFFNAQPDNIAGGLAIQKQEMHVRAQNESGFNDLPFTASSLSTTLPNNISEGWSYLPSGIIIKWGAFVAGNAGNNTHAYPTGADIPVFTKVYSLQVIPAPAINDPVSAVIRNKSATDFEIFVFNTTTGNGATAPMEYIAIGA